MVPRATTAGQLPFRACRMHIMGTSHHAHIEALLGPQGDSCLGLCHSEHSWQVAPMRGWV